MFWKRNRLTRPQSNKLQAAFEEAKEATRRAAFLSLAGLTSSDESYKQGLSELLRVCRAEALSSGQAIGQSESQVDNAIGTLCDQDNDRLKHASDKDIAEFAVESGEIVKRFLAGLDQR